MSVEILDAFSRRRYRRRRRPSRVAAAGSQLAAKHIERHPLPPTETTPVCNDRTLDPGIACMNQTKQIVCGIVVLQGELYPELSL